jgi:glutathione S-transferase
MSGLTLYLAKPSRGLVVKWMLEELGVEYSEKVRNLENKDHKTPEFLALNPMGRVPVLTHGDIIVTESTAICVYLAELFPGQGMEVPVGSPLRAAYLRWLFFAPVSAEPAILWQAPGASATGDYQPFASVEDIAQTLCEAVRGKEYVLEDRFTTVDVILGSSIYWGLELMPVLPKHPELVEYWGQLAKRDAWQRAIV